MVNDPEKQDPEAVQHVPQDLDSQVEHPGVSTTRDGEYNRVGTRMGDGLTSLDSGLDSDSIHSHSPSSNPSFNPETKLQDIQQIKSASSSTRSRPLVEVPRSQRRGILARLTIVPEVDKPYNYKRSTKWFVTFVVAIAAAAAPMGSAILLPALPDLAINLDTSQTVTNLSVALYMLAMAIFPLWWSSFSEQFGRRSIYITSFTFFTVWNIASALSNSIGMLIIMRILSGGCAASVQAVGAGTIADIWEVRERGRAMGFFYLGPLLGPLLAPIIGGALNQAFAWRSTQWFQVIYGSVLCLLILFCLPETLARKTPLTTAIPPSTPTSQESSGPQPTSRPKTTRPELTRVSTQQSLQFRTKKAAKLLHRCLIEPLYVLTSLQFPAVALTVSLASITFASLYILNISLQQTFSLPPYSFSSLILGLLYIAPSLGYFLASVLGGRWTDHIMAREARRAKRYDSETGKLVYIPEDRMRENAWLAAILFPTALIAYGWAVHYHAHWIIPCIINFFFGFGSMIVFGLCTTMLTEFMPKKSSSGVAVNNFIRNICACIGGVVAQPLIEAIGNGWLFTGLGVLCLVGACGVTFAMGRWGASWRREMDRVLGGKGK